MSFLGHSSTTAPHSGCAQRLQRQFLLLPLTNDLLFFLTLYILSEPDNLISLHPIDLFKGSSGHKGDAWGMENNWIQPPIQCCYVANIQFKRGCRKGKSVHWSTVTEIMVALLNLMCFLHFYDRFHIHQKRDHTFQYLKERSTAWKTFSGNQIWQWQSFKCR